MSRTKGAGPAPSDCTGRHIEVCFLSTASVVPHVTSKRLRALGIANMKRVASLPDVQTLDEQGVKAFESSSSQLLVAHHDTMQSQ